MNPLSRSLHGWAGLLRIPASLSGPVRLILAGASLLLALALLALLLVNVMPRLPPRFWQLLGLCAISLAVLWWFLVGARRFSRRGFARKHIGDLGPGNADQDQAALTAMLASIRQARQTIQRSPNIERGRDPLYRIPWLLFLGDQSASAQALLRTASHVSPFPAPGGSAADSLEAASAGTAPWQWWFFKSMIAIETAPFFVCDPAAQRERGLWYHALLQLAQERDKLPLNGIVVTIDAATLLSGAAGVRPVVMRLRRLVDEALEHLQVQLPVYLVVTGLEALRGYDTFRAVLPAEALTQALGHCLAEQDTASDPLDGLFDPIVDRLHALRLTALRNAHTPTERRGLFDFVEQIAGLREGLRTLVQLMLEDNPFQRTPRWRGLYLTASAGPQHGGAFVDDLFTRFLPADQPLATTNLKGHAGRLSLAGIGVAAMLGLSVMVSHGLQSAHRDDGVLLAQTRTACQEPRDAGASSRIAWVARCGQTVETLEAAQENTGLGFGLRQADRSIARTKDTLLRDFSNFILAPYDQVIEADLARGQTGVEHVLAITQRLRLLERCRKRETACRDAELSHNAAFDHHARVFSPFISGEQDGGSSRQHAVALFTSYLGYLRWQSPSVLDAEAQRLRGVLAKLLAANAPTVDQLQRWANARRDAITLGDYWLPAGRVQGVDEQAQASVSALFTQQAWHGYVEPMLQTAAQASPAHAAQLELLREQYLNAYQRAWGQFSGRFGEGLALWQGRYDELLKLAARPDDHPYQRLDNALRAQLLPLPLDLPLSTLWTQAWAEARNDWLSAWRPLGRFAGQAASSLTSPWLTAPRSAPAAWVPAWLETRAQWDADAIRNAHARGYLRLTQPGDGADLYAAMAALYRHTDITAAAAAPGPAQDYAVLLHAVEQPPERYASLFGNDDLQAWSVVQGPTHLLLFLSMQRTSHYLQARWVEGVYSPLNGLDPRQQAQRLYGPNGQLATYIKDWLTPFLTDGGGAPQRLAGVQLPLSPGFLGLLARDRQYDPAQETRPFLAAQVQFLGPSRLGSQQEGAGGSQLDILCQDRSVSVNSQGESLADGRAQVYWAPQACTEARLRIPLPDPPPMDDGIPADLAPPAQPLRLTLLYQGQDSFPALLRQFRQGAHTFRLADFQASYTPTQWAQLQPRLIQSGITQVRVFLRITPTPDMEGYLARGQQRDLLPATIFDV